MTDVHCQLPLVAAGARDTSTGRLAERHRRGVALVVVLWVLAILSVMVASYSLTVGTNTHIATNYTDEIRAEGLARAGMEATIAQLMQTQHQFTGADEKWQFHTSEDDEISLEAGTYEVLVMDEAAKLNANMATQEQLLPLVEDDAICMAILDWIDEDDDAEADGCESFYYESLQPRYRARNGPISTVGELGLVRGIDVERLCGDPRLFGVRRRPDERRGLADLLTVSAIDSNLNAEGEARLDLNSASQEDLQSALESYLSEDQIAAIIQYRDSAGSGGGGPGEAPTTSDEGMPEAPVDFASPTGTGMPPGDAFGGGAAGTRQAPEPPSDFGGMPTDFGEATLGQGGAAPPVGGGGPGTGEGVSEPGAEQAFSSLADLLSVEGIGTEEVASIADLVTTTDETVIVGRVNVNTAPQEVLVAALGLDESVAREILDWRRSEGPFQSIGQLLQLSGMDQETLDRIGNLVTVRSYVYSIESVGLIADSGAVKILHCTVDTSGRRPNLLAYSEQ